MTAAEAYWGRYRPMTTDDPAALGREVRRALWSFASRTTTAGDARDKMALALVRNRHPKAAAVFPDAAVLATLREKRDGACGWCAYRLVAAANGEPQPTETTPGLLAPLGKACARCRAGFEAARVVRRERAMLASGGLRRRVTGPQPTGAIWPAGKQPPKFYGSQPIQQRWR